ncbi:MAG: N-acetyltransferase family protein [Bacteroidetes bacterium]|nr:N-acetyltransferase family protein [Bacteroidota bacterium]
MIRRMNLEDASAVLEIYKLGILSGNATFESMVPSWQDWDLNHLQHFRYVFVEGREVLGWIALSPVSARKVYQGVAEVSVYVLPGQHGRGIGFALMEKVIGASEADGIWTLCSSVFPENVATLRLHEKAGFRIIGYREKIARLNNTWRNTLLLERRSKLIE